MAEEAAVDIVVGMRDEASQQMQNLQKNTQDAAVSTESMGWELGSTSEFLNEYHVQTNQATIQTLQFNLALTSMGSALTAVGSLMNQVDNEAAKMAANFLTTTGAILSTTSAVMQMIPYIKQMVQWFRNLAITQAIMRSLQGPAGWAILAGAGVAAAGAVYGINRLTGAWGGGGGGGGSGGTTVIQTPAFAGSRADARKFGSEMQNYQRQNTRVGR